MARAKRCRLPRRLPSRCAPAAGFASRANEGGRRSERCSARRPPTRFRGYQACYVGCVGRPRRHFTALQLSLRPRRLEAARFVQSRRPATLLPSSRRAPRECQKPCSVVQFGRENLLFRFCLGLAGLPCLHLYYVMAITARVKSFPCRARCSKPGWGGGVTAVAARGGGVCQRACGPESSWWAGSDDGDFHRKNADSHRKSKGLTPREVLA